MLDLYCVSDDIAVNKQRVVSIFLEWREHVCPHQSATCVRAAEHGSTQHASLQGGDMTAKKLVQEV